MFLLATWTYGSEGQEIGNGGIKHLLTLAAFEDVMNTLKGDYVLETTDQQVLFSVSKTGEIKGGIKGKISVTSLESLTPQVHFTLEVDNKMKPYVYQLSFIVLQEGRKKVLKLVSTSEKNLWLYKKNKKTKHF